MKESICSVKILPFLIAFLILISCQKKGTIEVISNQTGNILFNFNHLNNGNVLLFDTLIYKTSTGNQYMVNDLQYFISGVQVHKTNDGWKQIATDKGIHYTDARDKSTFAWQTNGLSVGTYDSAGFIFGLIAADNYSNRFPDPPERDMFWPGILGGGYHYMKMDLKWKSNGMPEAMPFMFHLGIGQIYKGDSVNTDSISGYVQNYFMVRSFVPFIITRNQTTQINIIMNVEKWFDSQNAFDFAAYPMGIMQDQDGMHKACLNGSNAFVVK